MSKNSKPRKNRRRWLRKLVLTLILLLVLAAVGFYGYSMLKQEYTVTYDSYTASTGSISNALSFSGNLNLVDSAYYTASSNSTVRTIYASVGDQVQEGDKLVRLANGETIEAGFDGRVNAIPVEEGDEVYSGDALMQLADFNHMKVTLRVDEYEIADVAVGQACTVTATATEKSFESVIDSIDYISASGGNVAYYSAVCYVDVDEGIYPGMQVTVSIPQEEAENVVILKMDALSFDNQNSAFVYMYDENEELIQVPVEVGVSNGNYVEIKSGLEDGDVVYVEVEEEAASAMGGLLSGIFGSQQMNSPAMGGRGSGGSMPDFGSMDGSSGGFSRGGGSGQMGGGQMGGGR
ncbi:MAG: HlyD family efflux transporter periplasmic adaptor subunit [Clostridia bacterium]|nr:HlyD family efflux transporter periplasmic adaptor subunit [Clostridia bacterium]